MIDAKKLVKRLAGLKMVYYKIPIKLPELDCSILKGEFFEGYGETFRQYHIKDQEYLNNVIFKYIKFHIPPDRVVLCEVNELGVDPHFDENTTALNYYLDPADCVTTFWKPKPTAIARVLPQLQQDGTLVETSVRQYDINDLEEIASFQAEKGDLYLLNIKQLHSAKKYSNNQNIRKIVRWMWDKENYFRIIKSIELINSK